ncbi:hypothetical protein IAR55_003566 [Kwoniella newhampshirensis]|uniref:F-box domain-containing protein n=1 Tax=Kwoniella newhampshirensis TaxID=1651941 RepID=A0AAW0YYV6_9TREE
MPTSTSPSANSPPPAPLPTLPFEIQRRIIHFRLALSPSYPSAIADDEDPNLSWDVWAGVKGRNSTVKRVEERKDVGRAARGLMGVCKAWKPVVMRYLYAEPHLIHNLPLLSSTIVRGDSKWSDINIHQFSLPGRYLTTLDLSVLSSKLHPTQIRKACLDIFPLVPNLTHLILPPMARPRFGGKAVLPFPLEEIGWAAFSKNMRCLEGVEVDEEVDGQGGDGLVELLRRLPNLEVLAVNGPGNVIIPLEERPSPRLRLSKLHTLKLDNVICGRLINTLIDADLPALRRLLITPFYQHPLIQTQALQEGHGDKIVSLAYLPSHLQLRSGGEVDAYVEETMNLHPNLRHLSFFLQDETSLEHLNTILCSAASTGRPLQTLTIPRWTDSPSTSSSSSDAVSASGLFPSASPFGTTSSAQTTPTPHRFLDTMIQRPPPNLKRVNVDGFKWVKAELGKVAMTAGKSGEMRIWAGVLARKGIELGDMDGGLAPALSPGGAGSGVTGCMGAVNGRRRSSAGAGRGRVGGMSPREGSGSPPRHRGGEDEDGG